MASSGRALINSSIASIVRPRVSRSGRLAQVSACCCDCGKFECGDAVTSTSGWLVAQPIAAGHGRESGATVENYYSLFCGIGIL